MKIEELISSKNDSEIINIEGASIHVSSLKKLLEDGYAHLKVYQDKKLISVWGRNCGACFTEQQLREKS